MQLTLAQEDRLDLDALVRRIGCAFVRRQIDFAKVVDDASGGEDVESA